MSELSTSSNVGDDDQQQLQITAEEKAAVADSSNSKGSSSSSSISSNNMPTPKKLPKKLPNKLPKKLPTKSSAAAAASASSGARVTDDLSMSTQMQLKRDLATASISSSSNSIYASGSAPASWREYYRSCGWFNSCISAGAAAPAAAATNSSSSSSSSSSSNSTAASAATRHKITNKKLDKQKVHVTETASEASLHAIAEAVAEFAIGD